MVGELVNTPPSETYLSENDEVWIGSKWDIARNGDRFHVYRKGNYQITVGSFDLARAIVLDDYALVSGCINVDSDDLRWLVDQIAEGFTVDPDAPTFKRIQAAV